VFAVTYLGQQGWSIAGARANVLVDPLLTDEYSPGFEARIHPPRSFVFDKFPAVDAVVLSHEHADHLNLPSLSLLDRRIPVILPARSADALRQVIADLGFRVIPSHPGSRFSVGDLTIELVGGELHHDAELESEWTTLQILVSDRAGDGSFFSYVDTWPKPETFDHLRNTVGRVGVFCHVNNTMDWSCLEGGMAAPWPSTTLDYATEIVEAEASWWSDDDAPALTVICGPGLAFVGADAWMNQILSADSQRVCEALQALAPERAYRAPMPGDTITLEQGRIRRGARRAPFVRAIPRSRWPSTTVRRRRALLDDYRPSCGRTALDDRAWPEVEHELDRLAAYLHRRSLFRTLLALDGTALDGRRPGFAIMLRAGTGDRAFVYEYQPAACRFARVDCAAPIDTYVAGLECWASDLWRVAVGQLLPQRLLGHMRTWSFSPIRLSPLQAIWGFFDPAYRPAAALAFYRGVADQLRDREPVIAAGPRVRTVRAL
jgi:hypothetical protein